jgi:hypothetical protein
MQLTDGPKLPSVGELVSAIGEASQNEMGPPSSSWLLAPSRTVLMSRLMNLTAVGKNPGVPHELPGNARDV